MGASSTPAVGGWVVVTSSWAVVVVSPAVGVGGPGGRGVGGGGAGVVARGAAAVVGAWAARATGDTPAGGSLGTVVLVDDDPGPALEGATAGGSAGNGGMVVSAGSCWTAEGARGVLGTSAADATRAASTANVSPKATSMRRQGSRCSARWRGFRGGMTCPRRRILRIVRSN